MSNNLMLFEGHDLEVFELDGIVYFNPYHVGQCLGMAESTVRNYLSKMNNNQVRLLKNSDVHLKDIRKLNNAGEKFLTESGVFKISFKSEKPEAEKFTDWVTDEVLPSIRQTGEYKLDNTQSFTSPEQPPVLKTMNVVKFIADDLRVSTSSRVKMYRQVCKNEGINSNFLPDYTDEKAGRSATELLKKFNIPMSTVKFNKLMLEHEFLKEETRTSTDRQGFKKYKSLTDKGLKYGKNQSCTRGSEKETQPLYYEDTFIELVNILAPLKEVI